MLEIDDLLLIGTDPVDGDRPGGGGPIDIDDPYLDDDEENQRKIGDPNPTTHIKIQPPD